MSKQVFGLQGEIVGIINVREWEGAIPPTLIVCAPRGLPRGR